MFLIFFTSEGSYPAYPQAPLLSQFQALNRTVKSMMHRHQDVHPILIVKIIWYIEECGPYGIRIYWVEKLCKLRLVLFFGSELLR